MALNFFLWGKDSTTDQEEASPDVLLGPRMQSGVLQKPTPCTVGRLRLDRLTFEQALNWLLDAILHHKLGRPLFIAGPNAYIIVLAEDNLRFREAMQSADLLLADGISIVIASILLGRRLPERIPGGEVMEQMCRLAALHGLRVYFLGGLEGAAEQAALVLSSRYPGLTFAGTYCPPIGFERDLVESQKVRELIMASKPDMLFVALGSPKQEIWMAENCQYFAVRTIMSVGAAFDTQAGLRKRAPQWAQKTGTEWLYRLIMEPRRLWKRYLIGNFRFMLLILRQIRTRRQ